MATRAEAAESAACAVPTRESQHAKTPADVLARLKAGNERLVTGNIVQCDLMQQVKGTASGQAPLAAIVGCIDSRVPPELVFDQKIGDIFCARVAGNFVNTDIIGSLEFATVLSGARAIVVLGHSSCGAIKGAIDNAKLGNLTATLANIRPAVKATKTSGERNSKNTAFVEAVAEKNVRMTVAALNERSPAMRKLVAAGDLKIVGAMHDIATGKVTWLS
ncbi:MAG: carbonic anhydrase family protein [Xanthobacteraceae bacterium]|nr:carbonic anhydrase family protein [Xanthobacteraceae bacterium]